MLRQLRRRLERGFSAETSFPGQKPGVPSAGQCAAVALIVHELLGGELVSAHVGGISHWFNRLPTDLGMVDIDTTADQFGLPPIRMSPAGELYPGTRVRQDKEVHDETRRRSLLLLQRVFESGVDWNELREIAGDASRHE